MRLTAKQCQVYAMGLINERNFIAFMARYQLTIVSLHLLVITGQIQPIWRLWCDSSLRG